MYMKRLIKNNKGQAMTEFIIIAFVLLLLTLGLAQLVFIYQTKTNLNYATFEAIRAGTLENASPKAIKDGFARGMAPSFVRVVDAPGKSATTQISRNTALATAYQYAYNEMKDYVRFQRINPTTEMFFVGSGWGKPIPPWEISQEKLQSIASSYIPNEHLLYKPATQKKLSVTIQDANLLKIRVTYCMKLIVPFVNTIFQAAYKLGSSSTDAFNTQCTSDTKSKRFPIVAQSIMRMQSQARNYRF